MRCAACGSVQAQGCQCSVLDSQTIHWTGSGAAANPFVANVILDPSPSNFASAGPSGLLVTNSRLTNPPRTRVHRATTHSEASGEFEAVGFTDEIYDTDNNFDFALNTKRFVCKTAGIYACGGYDSWLVAAPGTARYLGLFKNGVTQIAAASYAAPTVQYAGMTVSGDYFFNIGDYLELFVGQTSGAALGTPADPSDMWWHYVGPLP